MPKQNISATLLQAFDENELRDERCLDRSPVWGRLGHYHLMMGSADLDDSTSFGADPRAKIRPIHSNIYSPYIAGSLVREGRYFYLESADSPSGLTVITRTNNQYLEDQAQVLLNQHKMPLF